MPNVISTDGGFLVDGTFVDRRGLNPEQINTLTAASSPTLPQGADDWTNPPPAGGYVEELSAADSNAAYAKAMAAKAAAHALPSGMDGGLTSFLRGPNDAYAQDLAQKAGENALPGGVAAPSGPGMLAAPTAETAPGAAGITLSEKMAGNAPAPTGPSATPQDMATQMALTARGPGMGAPGAPGLAAANTKDLDAAYREQVEAAREGAKVGAARAAEASTYQATVADNAEKLAQQQAVRAAERQRALEAQTTKLQQLQDDFAKTSTVIDPSRWYASRDTGQKILAGLGIFLGGFGPHGNQALDIVRKAIDDDIDAQKTQLNAELMKKREGVGFAQSLLGQMRQNFGDEIAAEAAARSTMLDNAKLRLSAMASKYDVPEIQAKAQAAIAQLDGEKAKADFDFKNRWAEIGIKKEMADTERTKVSQEMALKTMEGKTAGNDRFVPGLGRYAIDADAAKKLRDAHANYRDLDGLLKQAIDLRKKYGSEDFGPAKTEMQSIGAQIESLLAKDDSIRLSDTGQRIVKQMTGGDINSWGYVQPALERLRNNVNQSFMNKAESYLDPNQPGGGGGAGYTLRAPGNG